MYLVPNAVDSDVCIFTIVIIVLFVTIHIGLLGPIGLVYLYTKASFFFVAPQVTSSQKIYRKSCPSTYRATKTSCGMR